jgi:hypothetical protein
MSTKSNQDRFPSSEKAAIEQEQLVRKTVRIPRALDSALRHHVCARKDEGEKVVENDVFIASLELFLSKST